jgi:hypothetical protein
MVRKEHGKFIRFLSDVLIVSATCLFGLSIVEPLMSSRFVWNRWYQMPEMTRVSVTYWSYRAIVVPNIHMQLLFNNYWFVHNTYVPIVFFDMSWSLVALFLTQVLTILSSLLSFFSRKKARAIPVILSIVVVALMIHTHSIANLFPPSSVQYEPGYWLSYPSAFIFYFALITSLAR